MEEVDIQTLPRKELLQLCIDNNIRTAGVKQDDLVRLLQKKLRPPAADPPRGTTKARSQINTNNPISSPRGKEKSAEKTLPTPGSTSLRRSLRPLVVEGNPSTTASPEPSPRKYPLPPNPGVSPRKPIATKANSPPPQKSDILRKKVNALTAIGKLQGQEKARLAQRSDGSSIKGRNNATAAAAIPGNGKQAQGIQPRRSEGTSARSRSSSATDAPKKSIRSTSMEPVKRPSERTTGGKRNEASRFKAQGNPKLNAAHLEAAAKRSPRASKGAASVTGTIGSHSDLGSQDFDTVSEVATDAGHHAISEGSDADDARSITSVASEPASRFASRTNMFHSPRASTGSKLDRGASPLWNSAHGRDSALDSSVESNAPDGKDSSPSASPSGENLIPPFLLEDDPSFNLVGDAHELEINSFLNIDAAIPEINAAEGSHRLQDPKLISSPEISTAGCQKNDAIDTKDISLREQDAGSAGNVGATAQPEGHSKPAPRDNLLIMNTLEPASIEEIGAPEIHSPRTEDKNSVPQPTEVSHLDETPSIVLGDQHESKPEEPVSETALPTSQKETSPSESNSNAVEEPVSETALSTSQKEISPSESNSNAVEEPVSETALPTSQKETSLSESNSNAVEAEEGPVPTSKEKDEDESGIVSPASEGANVPLISDERSEPCSPSHQGSPDDSTVPLSGKARLSTKDFPSGDESVQGAPVHSILDTAPQPHPDMERSSTMPMSVDSSTPESTDDLETAGEHDRPAKLRLPCDEVQQDFEIKTMRDHNKDGSVKVPLLQQGREIQNTHVTKRSFPSSVFLWCSQLFSAIFGTRSQS